jgi:hypothetical protein
LHRAPQRARIDRVVGHGVVAPAMMPYLGAAVQWARGKLSSLI